MGRGIRSNDDYCAVLLMGTGLIRALYATGATAHFSPATAAQVELSRQVSTQVANKGMTAVHEAFQDLWERNPGWVAAARNALIPVTYPDQTRIDPIAAAERQAFDAVRINRFDQAEAALRVAENGQSDGKVRGWLLDQVAAAVHHLDKVRSQQILHSAIDHNSLVTKPIGGIAYKRVETRGMDQARQAAQFLTDTYGTDGNKLLIGINGVLGDLTFVPEESEDFEQALYDLGLHLGFRSQRPEKDGVRTLMSFGASAKARTFCCPARAAQCPGRSRSTTAMRSVDRRTGSPRITTTPLAPRQSSSIPRLSSMR